MTPPLTSADFLFLRCVLPSVYPFRDIYAPIIYDEVFFSKWP